MVSSHATDETEITLVAMEIFLPGSNPVELKTRLKTWLGQLQSASAFSAFTYVLIGHADLHMPHS